VNNELLSTLLLASVFFLVFVGIYKTRLEKKVHASENIQQLVTGVAAHKTPSEAVQKKQIEQVLRRRNLKQKAVKRANDLERANWLMRPEEFTLVQVIIAVVCAAVAFFGRLPIPAIIPIAIGGFFLPLLMLKFKIMMRMKRAEAQFADVLDSLVNCFKTGYGFNRALQVISDNFEDPWGTEFGKMCTEISLGAQPEDVLGRLTDRVPSADVDLFVTALLIQRETGGNLAELLGNLSRICRERQKLYRKVGAISAQGKLSAGVVCCVPLVLFAMMYALQREAVVAFATNIIGIVLLSFAAFWMCCGIFVLWKMVQIEV
jgi:tight adherence protein B